MANGQPRPAFYVAVLLVVVGLVGLALWRYGAIGPRSGQGGRISNEELTQLLIGILGRINVESDEQRNQNRALFWASVIATLAWGFGDLIVQRIIHTCHCSC